MQSVAGFGGSTSSRRHLPSEWKLANGRKCQFCHRFGVFAPGQLKCCGCLGWLPLVFITVVIITDGGDA